MARKKGSKETVCVYCGKTALRMNSDDQPVCRKHQDRAPKQVTCPDCSMPMEVREGRYGYFWGCKGFPGCDKTYPLKALADEEESEE